MDLYTLKEIAQRLDLPESTVRKYRDIFLPFIPFVGSGRNRKYRDEALNIFNDIRHLREVELLSWETIKSRLAKKYAIAAEVASTQIPGKRGRPKQSEPVSSGGWAATAPQPAIVKAGGSQAGPERPKASLEAAIALKRTLTKVEKLDERNQLVLNTIALETLRLEELLTNEKDQRIQTSEGMLKLQKRLADLMVGASDKNSSEYKKISNQIRETKNGFLKLILAMDEKQRRLSASGDSSGAEKKIEALKRAMEDRNDRLQQYKVMAQKLKQENQQLKDMVVKLKAELSKKHLESAVSPPPARRPAPEPQSGKESSKKGLFSSWLGRR